MADPQAAASILTALGAGTVLVALVNGIVKWLTGASGRERVRNTNLLTQKTHAIEERVKAEIERDEADDARRAAMEYAHSLRWIMKGHGIEPPEIPPALLTERNRTP